MKRRRRQEENLWESTRAGRLDEHEELLNLATGFGAQRAAIGHALKKRARWILTGFGGRSHVAPVVIKQVSSARSIEAVRRIARYIGRLDVDYNSVGKSDRESSDKGLQIESASSAELGRASGAVRGRTPSKAALVAAAADSDRPPPIFDQFGCLIRREALLDTLLDWPLLEDADNLTRAGQAALKTGGTKAVERLPERRAFAQTQAIHIVASVPNQGDNAELRFERAVRRFVRTSFGEFGCSVLSAIHFEHGREMHAHFLVASVKPCSILVQGIEARGLRQPGVARFELDPDGYMADALRVLLADAALREKFEVDASRREDRRDLREKIIEGEAELRPRPTTRSFDDPVEEGGLDELPPLLRRLVRSAPGFAIEHATAIVANLAEHERRRFEMQQGQSPPPPSPPVDPRGRIARVLGRKAPLERELDALPKQGRDDVEALFLRLRAAALFADEPGRDGAFEAYKKWRRIRFDDRRMANWVLLNAPQVLGPLRDPAARLPIDPSLIELLDRGAFDDAKAASPVRSFREIARREPAMAADIQDQAIAAVLDALAALEEPFTKAACARRGRIGIARSFGQLADVLETAFPGDKDAQIDAENLRELAVEIRRFWSVLPTVSRDMKFDGIDGLQARARAQILAREEAQLRKRYGRNDDRDR